MASANETRVETQTTKPKMGTTEMRILRSILGITLLNREENVEIRKKGKYADLVKRMKTRKQQWYNQVEIMDKNWF